ncbi:hypothetical protein ID853_13115 [Xenorhabdus sp. Vera]|uniref:hypothetical protein n=1 Tax=Xenorhabdus koppenhoeferi TaxID=351659 RepID=UPI00198375DC|nr:hypothetical protein [Xenorhabdus sp. Vera]MBD2811801.1 hypothetical protein [Xenorhabdus sp. Vera]
MIFLAFKVLTLIIFFPLFMVVSHFFIVERKIKKTLLLSSLAVIILFLIDIFIPTLIAYPARVFGLIGLNWSEIKSFFITGSH